MRALAAALFLLIPGCTSVSDDPAGGVGDVELLDIHGLALDPTDASILYVATHRGLLRLDDDKEWSYVGTARDDFMGFTAHPTDPKTFWASGHPRLGGNLGVVRSSDGGGSWTKIGADGVDFHAMAVSAADPQRLYGSWRGDILRSLDGGATWAKAGRGAATGFAPHPTDPGMVYIASAEGIFVQGAYEGAFGDAVQSRSAIQALGIAVDPHQPGKLYVGTPHGVAVSIDDGVTFADLTMPHEAPFAFFATHAATPNLVYAASYQKGIYRSTDGGATWRTVLAPSP